jgi:3-oxocholest-4-en-26-oyl-CoA dehydrogenase alpha subunit
VDFAFSESAEQLRLNIRSVLHEEWSPGRKGYRRAESQLDYEEHKVFRRHLARHGWFGVGIPESYGGRGGTREEQYIVAAELAYHGVPYPEVAANMVAPTLLLHASEEMKNRFLPLIAAGELEFSLGFTEPDAGTDLVSLRTAAVRDGDEYVINGQKIFTSYIHRSEYCMMAVRTAPDAPPHRGISLIIVDVTTPGIGVQPLWGMGDIRTNVTYWDDVRVPATNLVGEENAGWSYLTSHLDFERINSFTVDSLRAPLNDLLQYVCSTSDDSGTPLRSNPWIRGQIAHLVADVVALDTLTRRAIWLVDDQGNTSYESSEVKILATELRQRLTTRALEMIGESAQLLPGDTRAPLEGAMFRAAEGAIMQTFGAGANEVQRDIVARRGLALPRS